MTVEGYYDEDYDGYMGDDEHIEVIHSWGEYAEKYDPQIAAFYEQEEEHWLNYEAGLEHPEDD